MQRRVLAQAETRDAREVGGVEISEDRLEAGDADGVDGRLRDVSSVQRLLRPGEAELRGRGPKTISQDALGGAERLGDPLPLLGWSLLVQGRLIL